MPEWIKWIFDGMGTEILSIIVSLIIGGTVGYKIGVKQTATQSQRSGDDSKQNQELKMGKNDVGTHSAKTKTNLKQSQKAGNTAVQTQIGGINDDRG